MRTIRQITKVVSESKVPIILPSQQGTREVLEKMGQIYQSFNPELAGKLSFLEFKDHNFNIPLFLDEIQNNQSVTVESYQDYRTDTDYFAKLFKLSSPDGKSILFLVQVYNNEPLDNIKNKEFHKIFANKADEIYVGSRLYVVSIPGAMAMKKKIVQGAYDLARVDYVPSKAAEESVLLYLPTGDPDEYVQGQTYNVIPFENTGMCKIQFGSTIHSASIQAVTENLYKMMTTRSNGGLRNVLIRGGSSTGKSSLMKQIQLAVKDQPAIQMMLTPEQLTNVIYQDPQSMKVFNFMRNKSQRRDEDIIIYVDEAEDLLYNPAHSFKSFLDGSLSDLVGNPGIIMTTSRMDPLDPELARPGRLDVIITLEPLNRAEAQSQAAVIESFLEEDYTYDYKTLDQILATDTPYSKKDQAALGEVFQGVHTREDWDDVLNSFLTSIQEGEAEFIKENSIELPIELAPKVKFTFKK